MDGDQASGLGASGRALSIEPGVRTDRGARSTRLAASALVVELGTLSVPTSEVVMGGTCDVGHASVRVGVLASRRARDIACPGVRAGGRTCGETRSIGQRA